LSLPCKEYRATFAQNASWWNWHLIRQSHPQKDIQGEEENQQIKEEQQDEEEQTDSQEEDQDRAGNEEFDRVGDEEFLG